MRFLVYILLAIAMTVCAHAQEESYEEDFADEPFDEQLAGTLNTPLNLNDPFDQFNGSLLHAEFDLDVEDEMDFLSPQGGSSEQAVAAPKASSKPAKKKRKFRVNWGNFMISSAVLIAGGAAAYYGDLRAKQERDAGVPASRVELNDRIDAAKNWQIIRAIGYCVAGIGALGVVLTLAF